MTKAEYELKALINSDFFSKITNKKIEITFTRHYIVENNDLPDEQYFAGKWVEYYEIDDTESDIYKKFFKKYNASSISGLKLIGKYDGCNISISIDKPGCNITCPKCKEIFYVNNSKVLIGAEYNILCPKCGAEFTKIKKIKE